MHRSRIYALTLDGRAGGKGGIGIGEPLATSVECSGFDIDIGDFGVGGMGGSGMPSATRDEPIANRPRWRSWAVEGSNSATRTTNVNTLRIRPLSLRKYMVPPTKIGMGLSIREPLPQSKTKNNRFGGFRRAADRTAAS